MVLKLLGASYTVFTLLISSAGLCRVSDSGGPESALPIPKPVSPMQLIVGDNQPAPSHPVANVQRNLQERP
jgi:hypothetical protein